MDVKQRIDLLIYDENVSDRKSIITYLHQDKCYDFNIIEAEAEEQIASALLRKNIDLIILNSQIYSKNDINWLNVINNRKIAPTIILTGDDSQLSAAEIFMNGAFDYLQKSSISTENLNKCIVNALDKWNFVRQIEDYKGKL